MSYELDHATTECPNEDCYYCGNLEDFTDECLEDEYYCDDVREINLVCPKCGYEFSAEIEPVLEYRVEAKE